MKHRLWIPVLALSLAGSFGRVQDRGANDALVKALESRVVQLEERLKTVESYLQTQAKSMTAFGSAVDAAVERGFTFGINPESRQVLVEAWRAQVKSAQSGLPTGKASGTGESPKGTPRSGGGR